ncbi:MAG TPA: lipoprotein-releasing ABC transporter permease subunit [Deltaproteobacteria bacterium]|nr:lipoprotein-releasing ABC transporter permease subunit [Deltaproteobacteria bacterium]HPR55115.1 lipoprotein-releasing ABC transporter permease subunit [Deltaproteobacteria bacterium]
MKFEFLVARKYLRAKKSQRFISFTSGLSVAGIAIGVMALIVVLSVMNGFEEDIKTKLLGTQSHIVISHYQGGIDNPLPVMQAAMKVDGVVAATPFILSQGLVSTPGGISGAVIRGIDPVSAAKVIRLKEIITHGTGALDDSGILVGSELAAAGGIVVGDAVTLVSPSGTITPLGMIPASRTFIVRGIFSTGMYEFDSNMVYISLPAAKKMFMMDRVSGVEVKVDDIYQADLIAKKVLAVLGEGYWAKTWKDMNKSLFSALRLEKTIMFIILLFIILVAAFSIISTLIMMVMEKRKEIAILKSMGATTEQILRIFITVGMTIGISGTLAGLGLGLLLAENLNAVVAAVEFLFKIQVMPKDVYYITGLPTKVDSVEVAFIVTASLLLCFLATIYPARQAARQDPVEVMRYEG